MGSAIAINQALQGNPLHGHTSIEKTPLKGLRLPTDGHDVARSNGQVVVGVVQLVCLVDGDNLETTATDVVYK